MRSDIKNTLNIILIAAVIAALISGTVLISGCKGGDMTIEEAAAPEVAEDRGSSGDSMTEDTAGEEEAEDAQDSQEDIEEVEKTEETPVEIIEAVETADDYFKKGMYAEAAREYRDALRMIKDADISQELEEELLSAISQNHQDAESITETARMHHGNAMSLQYEKRFEEAKAELEAALDIYPEYQTAIDALDSLEALMGLK